MKKRIYSSAIAALIIFAACNKAGKYIQPSTKELTESVYASGVVTTKNEYKVYAMADGYICDLLVSEGSSIKAGDVLFRINANAQNAAVAAAQNALANAQRNAGNRSAVLQELENAISNAKLKLRIDSINYARYKILNDKKAVATIDYDRMRLAYETSKNELSSAYDRLQKTKQQVSVDEKNAEASVENAQKEKDYTAIKASSAGVVFKLMKENGELVKRGELVAIIGNANHFYVRLNVDAADISKLKNAQQVLLKTDIDKDKIYKAHVSKIYTMMNASDQSFRVDAEFDDAYNEGFNGTNTEANIIISTKSQVLTIPKSCLVGKDSVYISDGGDEKKIKIATGIENFDEIEVVSGLNKDSKIINKK